jgi:uncharacterized protein
MAQSTSRRAFLLTPVLGASTFAYARYLEPTWLEFTERHCPIPHLTGPITLIHLSDLHASTVVPKSLIEHAVDLAIDARPDIICLTGDYVTTATGFDSAWYTSVLGKLARRAPTIAVFGNHDGGLWSASRGGFRTTAAVERILTRAGIQVLSNDSCKLGDLQFAGPADLWTKQLDAARTFRDADPQAPTILLSHNPDSKTLLADHPWTLMLSGHTHGGQVVVPILGLSPAPVEDRNYISGLKPWRDRWIHVSRGVGNVHGVRFNCRPEVTRLVLSPTAPGTSRPDTGYSLRTRTRSARPFPTPAWP